MRKTRRQKLSLRQQRYGYLFILPWLAGILLFAAWPLAQCLYFSFCDVQVTANGLAVKFWGFLNYQNVWLKDIFFIRRVLSFLLSTVMRLPIILVFSMIIALMLNAKIRCRGFFRTIFFFPVIIISGPVVNELNAQGAASIPLISEYGIMQAVSGVLPDWLAEPITSLFSQLVMVLWFSGVQILVFIAGFQQIDRAMYEAAKMDGASGWEMFWKITLPSVRPMILLNAIYTLVFLANSDQNAVIYDISYAMLDSVKGYGFASAMAWIHTLVVGAVLLILLGIFGERRGKAERQKKEGRAG